MAEDKDLETLTDFVHSDGFSLFGAHVQREWGPSGLRFQQAVREAAEGKEGAVQALQMVLKVQEELLALMSWPKNRVEELRGKNRPIHPMAALSRRGPGL